MEAVQTSALPQKNGFNATMDFKAIVYMIDALIRFDKVDLSDPVYKWIGEQATKIKASDVLKLLRSVSQNVHPTVQ